MVNRLRELTVVAWAVIILSGVFVLGTGFVFILTTQAISSNQHTEVIRKEKGILNPGDASSLKATPSILVRGIATGLVGFLVGIGVLRRRRWGRMLGIIFSIYILLASSLDLFNLTVQGRLTFNIFLQRGAWAFIVGYLLFLLTRPQIKASFEK